MSLSQRIHDHLYIADCDGPASTIANPHRCITGFELADLPRLLMFHGYKERQIDGVPQHFCPECQVARLLDTRILTE